MLRNELLHRVGTLGGGAGPRSEGNHRGNCLIPRSIVASAAALWAALFGLLHAFWSVAYFYWPAAGTATLGKDFMWAFSRPGTQAYNLVVAMLFGVAAVLAQAVTRPHEGGVPRWVLAAGLPTAGTLLFLRGAAGVAVVLLKLLGVVDGRIGPLIIYDFVFLLGGSLFLALAITFHRAGHR